MNNIEADVAKIMSAFESRKMLTTNVYNISNKKLNTGLETFLVEKIEGSKSFSDQGRVYSGIPRITEERARSYVTNWYKSGRKQQQQRNQDAREAVRKRRYSSIANRLKDQKYSNYVNLYSNGNSGLKSESELLAPRVYIGEGEAANRVNVQIFVVTNKGLVGVINGVPAPEGKYKSIEKYNMSMNRPSYGKALKVANVVKLERARTNDRVKNKKYKRTKTPFGFRGKPSWEQHQNRITHFQGIYNALG